ncbi:hypothetical protein C0993_010440 [Termitomyces sp. T159_Od127]|nr:hypothetical protein C0993_010440 [Termitomyces sp. T159_Od127]
MGHIGSRIGFYGSIWDGQRLRVEPLTRAFDLTTNFREKRERDEMASTLDALTEAVTRIQEHHSSIEPTDSWNDCRLFPFLSTYIENGQTVNFTYGRRLPEKLVFCVTVNDPHGEIQERLVKFTNQYSYDAHVHLSKLNLSPRIRAMNPISTDWTAIVMDNLELPTLFDLKVKTDISKEDRDKVRNKVRGIVQELHEGGFVHGDVRDTNILVDPASLHTADVMVFLIDFDWAGAAGDARYPNDINTQTLEWPKGVKGGELILSEHDLELVKNL